MLGEGAKVSFRDAGDKTREMVVKGGATAQRQTLGRVPSGRILIWS